MEREPIWHFHSVAWAEYNLFYQLLFRRSISVLDVDLAPPHQDVSPNADHPHCYDVNQQNQHERAFVYVNRCVPDSMK